MDARMSRAQLSFWSVYTACVILVLWHIQALTLMSLPLGQSLSTIEGIAIFVVVGYAAERTVLPVGRKATQDLSTTVHIAALLLFPMPFPMAIALLSAFAAMVRRGEGSRARRMASTFRPTIVVGLTGGAMSLVQSAPTLLKNGYSETSLPLLGLLALTYVVFDGASLMVELIACKQDKPLHAWLRMSRQTLLPEMAAATTGLLVAIVWRDDTLLVTLFVAPVFALYVSLNAIGSEHNSGMLRRRGEQLEAVVAVGQRLRVQQAPPDLLRPVADAARDLFTASLVGAYLRDPDAPTTLTRVVVTPIDGADPGPLLIPAAFAENGFQEGGYGRDRVVIVPIEGEGGVVGMLRLAGVASSIEHDDRDALLVLANQAAIALQNMRLHEWALARASEDGLTALLNHRAFQVRLESESARALDSGRMLSLLMVDLDDFRTVNNTYGHQVGDRALAAVAATLRAQMRGSDVAARYGGDEFAVILPETPFEDAFAVGRRIQIAIAALALDVGGATVRIGSSVGVAALPRHARTREDLIKAADRAAYAAKHGGKDRVATPEDAEEATAIEAGAVALAVELEHANLATVEALATAVDAKDSYTRGHSQRVSLYAEALARSLRMDPTDVARVRLAGLLHDVGKIGVPDAILTKFDPLTDDEFAILQRHPAVGESMLAAPFLHEILPAVRHHHERWDGKGYPDGLAGSNIPLDARILMLADSLDAMTSSRTYRKAFSFTKARALIHEGSGTQFDARVVEAFERAISAGLLRLISIDATRVLSSHLTEGDHRAAV